jgi:hypothetical protein
MLGIVDSSLQKSPACVPIMPCLRSADIWGVECTHLGCRVRALSYQAWPRARGLLRVHNTRDRGGQGYLGRNLKHLADKIADYVGVADNHLVRVFLLFPPPQARLAVSEPPRTTRLHVAARCSHTHDISLHCLRHNFGMPKVVSLWCLRETSLAALRHEGTRDLLPRHSRTRTPFPAADLVGMCSVENLIERLVYALAILLDRSFLVEPACRGWYRLAGSPLLQVCARAQGRRGVKRSNESSGVSRRAHEKKTKPSPACRKYVRVKRTRRFEEDRA